VIRKRVLVVAASSVVGCGLFPGVASYGECFDRVCDAGSAPPEAASPDAGAFCAAQTGAAFCDDFEGPSFTSWTRIDEGPPVRVVARDSDPERGGILRTSIAANPPICSYAGLEKVLDADAPVVSASFALRVANPGAVVYLSQLQRGDCNVLFLVGEGRTELRIQTPETNQDDQVASAAPVREGVWARLGFEVDWGAGKVSVTVDGQPGITAYTMRPACLGPRGTTRLKLGLYCVQDRDPATETRYDDVLVRYGRDK